MKSSIKIKRSETLHFAFIVTDESSVPTSSAHIVDDFGELIRLDMYAFCIYLQSNH